VTIPAINWQGSVTSLIETLFYLKPDSDKYKNVVDQLGGTTTFAARKT
jgi:hypothetical protein